MPAALQARGDGSHGCGHRRADPGRRRRAADQPGDGRRDHRRVRAAPARCSSPTKCSAASGAPDGRSTPASSACSRTSWRSASRSAPACRLPRRCSRERVAAAAAFGDHGSTYGGNLLACRAALVFLDELVDAGLMAHVARRRRARSRHGCARSPSRHAVRARSPRRRTDVGTRSGSAGRAGRRSRARSRGCWSTGRPDTVVRLLPPYIITADEIDEAIGLLDAALHAAFGGHSA